MSTKSDKDSFIEQSFTTSENQCYNLNLNQRKKCTTLIPVQSNSKTNNATDCTVSDNYEENEKLQLWNKSSKVSNFTTHNEDNEDLKNRWKNENALKTTNKSTLSLHIADYENSTEAAASDFFDDENIKGLKRQKFGSIKTSKKCLTDILKSQNPFEFPTQQNGDQRIKPELMQFKASQLGSSQPSSAIASRTMWITSRSLYHQLTRVLTELDNESLSEELVKNLRDNIQHITKPLTNKPKNASQRNLLEPTKTVILANGQKFVLNQVISDEAKILSDLFDVNEIDAVELILTGELQTRNFNTLPRGLCAVVCYYEAHRHFILILKMLLRLKSVADDMMPTILVEFVDSLLKDKELFKRVLYILQNFNVKSEFEKLQKPTVNGLGTVEHQRALMECIEDIEKSCYEILCIFCHNSLIELQAEILDLLFTALRAVPLEQDSLRFSTANLAIWTSILVFINPSRLKHSQNIQQIFEIFRKNLYEKWNNPTCCASIAFCFSIAVRCSRNYPGGFRNQIPLEESKLLDTALDNCALQFIRSCIIDVRDYASFEVTVDIIDSFIKSFLCYFQDKNQELFNICEDELSGINETDEDYIKKPNLYYLKFLDMVTHAYSADSSKVASLCEQFTLSKYTPLVNFLTNARSIASPRLFIPYIEMIKTFCKTERIAQFVFEIFTGDERSMLSWDRLFSGLSQYLNDFNGKQRQLNWQTKPSTLPQKIGTTELAGILTFLRLAKIVAEKSDNARLGFYGSHRWNVIEIATGMLIEPFPATLKGVLYEFLASLAIDERASMRIWSSLIQKKICTFDNNALHGIQDEFQKEKVSGIYNCTMGFLKLISRLLSRKNVPTSKELTPYLQFITGSIMGTFNDGKFSNTDQLYLMLTLCIDSIYQLLRHFYITTESVSSNKTQVYILGEILNDSELCRTILLILTECSNRIEDYSPKNEFRDKLSLACLRLLSVAVGHRQSFIVAIRKSGVSKLVSTLEKLFLSPLAIKANTTYLNVLMSFVSTSENLIKHTFFVVKILQELTSQRPSLQAQLVSVLFSQKELYQSIFTRLTSVYDDEISISPNDIPLFDLPDANETTKTPRLRGEIARLITEIFIDSLEADPTKPNLAYLFCGFDLQNIGTSILTTMDTVGESTSCLQSFINITEIFIAHSDPFNASFAALFEPTLRFFLRMLSFKTESSAVMLRYLRVNYDLIYRLTTSSTFQKIDYIDNVHGDLTTTTQQQQHLTTTFIDINQPSCTDPIFRRAVQGIILQLSAIELTSLLAMGQTSEPQKYYSILFSPAIQHILVEDGDESSTISAPMKELPLIWALLENSKADCDKLPLPALQKFDDRRVDEILEICLRDNGIGVEQYDVLYLQFLLITEIDSIISAEIKDIEMECQSILRYCTRYNARRLVEASCVHLLSGWVAVINTLAYFAPVNFIEVETQRLYLIDALFLILKYTGDIKVNDAVAGGISNTVYRLVSSIADLVALDSSIENRRLQLGEILTQLFHYLISSDYAKCVSFKLDLYGSIMKIFTLCSYKNDEEIKLQNGDISMGALESILTERKKNFSSWGSIFAGLSENVISAICDDINFAPFQLKIVAAACLTEILREDLSSNQHVSQYFVKSGNVNSILSSLRNLKIDFNHILDRKNRESCSYFVTIMSLFTRLASTNCGWNALIDYLVVPTVSSLKFWKDIPRGFFTGKEWNQSFETAEGAYTRAFECFMQFCLAMASNPYWKTISCPLLEAIERNQELTNQLIRTHPTLSLTKMIALLVFYIHNLDDNAKEPIETTKCLNDLLLLHTNGAPKTGFELTNLPTRSAFNLPLNLFTKRS